MPKLVITNLRVRSHDQHGKASGTVAFSDGKTYEFEWDRAKDQWSFTTTRRAGMQSAYVFFTAPKRAALLQASLDARSSI